jgi:hypothetical protein
MKPDVIDDSDESMRGVNKAEEMMLPYFHIAILIKMQQTPSMDGEMSFFSSGGCPKQFRIVKKSIPHTKKMGKDHAVNGIMLHCVQTIIHQRVGNVR